MKFTQEQNEARKQFVVKMLVAAPGLTNVEVWDRVNKQYGTGMVSERITEFRKIAKKVPLKLHSREDQERLRAAHISKQGKKPLVTEVGIAGRVEARVDTKFLTLTDAKIPVEIYEALKTLKESVKQHYRTGGLSMNISDAGELSVKYEFEPKVPIRGEVTL